MKVVFITSGCKTNQADSLMISEELVAKGVEVSHKFESGDIFVINSCTVTAQADRDARSAINRAKSLNPAAKVIVTGCYAQSMLREHKNLTQKTLFFLGNGEKENLISLILDSGNALDQRVAEQKIEKMGRVSLRSLDKIKYLPHLQTRPFLKIQDGCNYECAYCIVPLVRGAGRSIPAEEVIESLRRYEELGAQEVVLTGVHLGDYGKDLGNGETDLLKLLERISKMNLNLRLRLSSLEPQEIPDCLIDLVASSKIFCRHFHIPLQSGSDEILQRMKRPYTTGYYRRTIERIRERIPDAAIGIDLIAGFPTESERHFMETLDFITSLDFSYMHVFTFSPRFGTAAFSMSGQVSHAEKKARSAELIRIGREKKRAFYSKFVGRELEVVFEYSRVGEQKKELNGFSDNYIRTLIKCDEPEKLLGRIVRVVGIRLDNLLLVSRQ